MLNISALLASGYTPAQRIASLPHYSAKTFLELPADAAPVGVFADGDIYFRPYDLLTPNDISLLKQVTGQSFDPATVAAEQAAGTFQGNALADAIGNDRADSILGLGGPSLAGNVTVGYLQSIESALANPLTGHSYDGLQISSTELIDAIADLSGQSGSTINAVA